MDEKYEGKRKDLNIADSTVAGLLLFVDLIR